MNYTVRTTFRDSARAKPSVATIDLLMSSARMQLRSNEVEIYRDSASAFMIVPSIRTIYRSDAGLHNLSMGDPMQLMAMRDTLLALSERTECREVVGPGGIEQARVMLHLNPRGVARFRCSSLEFLLERATPSLRGIRVIYAGRSEIASVEMTFNEIDYNYQTSELDRPIASLVMSTDGQLNERYRGYRLIDTRTEESAK